MSQRKKSYFEKCVTGFGHAVCHREVTSKSVSQASPKNVTAGRHKKCVTEGGHKKCVTEGGHKKCVTEGDHKKCATEGAHKKCATEDKLLAHSF